MLDRLEKLIYDVTLIDLYWHRLASSVMKEHDLKGSYAIYFAILRKYPEGLTSATLAQLCGKDKADVSRDINALEKKNYMKRIQTGENRYRARVALTEQGQALNKTILKKAETAVFCIGKDLSDQDRDIFYKVLDEITVNMQSLSETGIPE